MRFFRRLLSCLLLGISQSVFRFLDPLQLFCFQCHQLLDLNIELLLSLRSPLRFCLGLTTDRFQLGQQLFLVLCSLPRCCFCCFPRRCRRLLPPLCFQLLPRLFFRPQARFFLCLPARFLLSLPHLRFGSLDAFELSGLSFTEYGNPGIQFLFFFRSLLGLGFCLAADSLQLYQLLLLFHCLQSSRCLCFLSYCCRSLAPRGRRSLSLRFYFRT